MEPVYVAALTLLAVVAGAIFGMAGTMLWHQRRSAHFREVHEIPDILGEWRCRWFDDSGSPNEPKVEDTVRILKWTGDGQFIARGHQPQFELTYPIAGEIDPSRVVIFVYKAARYPYEPNRGVVCAELSRDGRTMEGRWYGRRFSGRLGGGVVRCIRQVA